MEVGSLWGGSCSDPLRASGGHGQRGGCADGDRWAGAKEREASRSLPGPTLGEAWRWYCWWYCWEAEGEDEFQSGQAGGHQVEISRRQGAEGPGTLERCLGCGQSGEGPGRCGWEKRVRAQS